jgi:hypothetical protein
MPNATTRFRLPTLAAALALAACSGGQSSENNLAALDNQLNAADPALTSALEDQIAVDPQLAQQSNQNAVRPPATPAQAQYPVSAGAGGTGAQQAQLAAAASGDGGAACPGGTKWSYDAAWAQRLSPTFPIYPGARVTEAAGANEGDCRKRIVTFTTGDPLQRVLDWYYTQAHRAGYNAEHQIRDADHILAGTNESDGGAYYLIVTPKGSGAEVALITNKGR